jgi:hypothetical protein
MRLIEYYQGVLFLTSNRVDCFDEAFHSRITVALKYDPLTQDVRRSVWDMLMKAAGVKGVDSKPLSDFNLNGRQIKNCVSFTNNSTHLLTLKDMSCSRLGQSRWYRSYQRAHQQNHQSLYGICR